MRTGYTQIDEWPVRPYSKRELAMAYAPEISPVSALKPALARGELRTIAATTWSEYKQYFERDAALERR